MEREKAEMDLIVGMSMTPCLVVPKYDIGRQRVKALSDSNRSK